MNSQPDDVVEVDPGGPDKRVTWGELFFDLVFVFAVTQVSGLLHHDHSWAGLGRALIVFVPIYWSWVGISVHANTHDVDKPLDRIGIFAVGLCALFMALATPDAYHDRGALFGISYYAVRILLALLIFRGPWLTLNPYSVAVFVSGPLLLIGGLLSGPTRVALWGLAAATDLATPRLLRSRLLRVRFDPAHMPERFGLFLLIALGESIVSAGVPVSSARHLSPGAIGAVAAGFVLIAGLWWVYFHFAAGAMEHSMRTAAVQTDIVRKVLAYGHLLFIASIITLAAGLTQVVSHPTDRLQLDTTALLFGGTALYLATFGYTRWQMFRLVSTTRLTAAGLVVALSPLGYALPGIASVAIIAVAVTWLNVVEYLRVRRQEAQAA